MSAAQDISKLLIEWLGEKELGDLVPLDTWCEKFNKNPNTVRSWISRKVIAEGKHVFKDPTGHWWISCNAMNDWIMSGYSANDSAKQPTEIPANRKAGRPPKMTRRRSSAPKLK